MFYAYRLGNLCTLIWAIGLSSQWVVSLPMQITLGHIHITKTYILCLFMLREIIGSEKGELFFLLLL